jgi:peptide/nickel transport system permease protein
MGIFKFIIRRVLFGLLTMFVVATVVFVLTQIVRDPAKAILGRDGTGTQLAAKRAELGLDRPKFEQYWTWLRDLVFHQTAPKSFTNKLGMWEFLGDRIKNSVFLMFACTVISIPLSVFVGAVAARRRDRAFDSVTSGVNLFLAGTPEYVLGIALLFLFSTNVFHLFPGTVRIRPGQPPWVDLKQLVLPVMTLVLAVVPYVSRTMRASTVEVLESDYVEMARLKGLSEGTVLWRHALPNAIGPTLQVIAINIAYLVAGVITVEALFNYPGVGLAMRDAVLGHDAATVQFIAIFISSIYVIVNLLADVGTILVTPRLRTTI